ncbi:MAG: ABC transporter ATP-binding protein [Eubacteriales bacterium]|nr:ABC transporter ATP-binding protein [Eubacteriales bacterium]
MYRVDVLSMEGITKIYGNGFIANKDVTFTVREGEIHGLLGENGAGKTTLMKVLFGQEEPDDGRIVLRGEEVKIANPLKALELGIGMVHQHFMLVDSLTVAENLVLGIEPRKGLSFDLEKAIQATEEISARYKLPINPRAIVDDLSVGEKQRLEILKILYRGANILLLDEPTAVLTPQETEELFKQLTTLKKQGYTIVFISHKLNEIKEICDRITVLRKGRVVATADVCDVTELEISKLMVGRDVDLQIQKDEAKRGDTVLKVRNLEYINNEAMKVLKKLSFDVRAGEILGVASIEGNGHSELSEIVSGLRSYTDGEVQVCGQEIRERSIRALRESGESMIHEDRMIYGVSPEQSISENIITDRFYKQPYSQKGILKKQTIQETADVLIDDFQIACDGPTAPVKTLSGGNIQKVVTAREFSANPKMLIACQPTRGIDVGAAELIREKLVELRDQHRTAILLFSADLTELLTTSDSIIVLYDGEIVAYFDDPKAVNESILGEYMLGLKRHSEAELQGVIYEK